MDFDTTPSRENTFAYKWEKYKGADILPTWIADTEFACAKPILDALKHRIDHGILGYTLPKHHTGASEAVVAWCKQHYNWHIESEWIVWNPGVVPAFNMACQAFCNAGDSVIVQTPNYPPLLAAPKLNGLNRVCVDTINVDGRWMMDFDALETYAARPECKLFIMCNPMNPVGSALSLDEIRHVSKICRDNDVVLCSDEIHCDLVLDGTQHIPAGSVDIISDRSITLMAASKTFNVAGLGTSFAIVPDTSTRASFVRGGAGIVPWPNVLGLVAAQVAFTECEPWRQKQLQYLRTNRDYLVAQINAIKGLEALSPQATFLLWVDGTNLNVTDTQAWCEQRGVGPSPGRDFGAPNFFRLNYGCSFSMLEQIVSRLQGNNA